MWVGGGEGVTFEYTSKATNQAAWQTQAGEAVADRWFELTGGKHIVRHTQLVFSSCRQYQAGSNRQAVTQTVAGRL